MKQESGKQSKRSTRHGGTFDENAVGVRGSARYAMSILCAGVVPTQIAAVGLRNRRPQRENKARFNFLCQPNREQSKTRVRADFPQ
jgi:hypothetical protein